MLVGEMERLLWAVVLVGFFFLLHGLSGRREGRKRC